ncbi:MAG TPA: DUF4402 domain-containing protein [Prolixibacteraceae bacterium]|jgi:hypothetical protein
MKKVFLIAIAAIGFTTVSFGENPVSKATATATATVRTALSIVKAGDLSFGAFTVETAGTVAVGIDGLAEITGGSVLTSETPATNAIFNIAGDNEGQFVLTLPTEVVELTDGVKPSMTIAPASWVVTTGTTLSTEGKKTINVGATLAFAANQPVGSYSADFDVTVAYE